MPLYDIECQDCGHVFEIIHSRISEPVPKYMLCPSCNRNAKVKKMVSTGTDFHLKGSGWFEDGYSSTPKSEKNGTKNIR